MSDDTTQNDDHDSSPKALRDALEKANRELAELRKARAEAEAKERRESLTTILKAKGLKESAVNHYQGDVSEDAVVKWATDLGLLNTEEAQPDPNVEAARRAAQASGPSLSDLGISPGAQQGPVVGDPYKVLELLNTPGFKYEDGVRLGIFPKDPNTV